ncbi:MAG: hypothetical protein HF973_14170 [Chloroflexi bacterium]|nr:hypothetical protein [Chloroflexota bacterium]
MRGIPGGAVLRAARRAVPRLTALPVRDGLLTDAPAFLTARLAAPRAAGRTVLRLGGVAFLADGRLRTDAGFRAGRRAGLRLVGRRAGRDLPFCSMYVTSKESLDWFNLED